MKDLILYDVVYEKDGSIWKIATIKSLGNGGRCAVSKTESIGPNELYYFEKNVYHSSVKYPPKGSKKVICLHYNFHPVSTKINQKLKIEVENIPNTSQYRLKYPMIIKKKKFTKNKNY